MTRLSQFDIAILGAAGDSREIGKLYKILQRITRSSGEPLSIVTLDSTHIPANLTRTEKLEYILRRSTSVFLYVSVNLECTTWGSFLKNEVLEDSLIKENANVVPIYPDIGYSERNEIFGLRGIRGIEIPKLLGGSRLDDIDTQDADRCHVNQLFAESLIQLVEKKLYLKKRRLVAESRKLQLEDARQRVQ